MKGVGDRFTRPGTSRTATCHFRTSCCGMSRCSGWNNPNFGEGIFCILEKGYFLYFGKKVKGIFLYFRKSQGYFLYFGKNKGIFIF